VEETNRNTSSWVLDTGATNHMSGAQLAFTKLNTEVHGNTSFGGGSVAAIEGYKTVLFNCKNGEHRSFAGIYYIPRLTSNIINVGQLDEVGYKINIDDSILRIREQSQKMLARVLRRPDWLYLLELDVARLMCLTARGKEEAWQWRSRMGYVNMKAMWDMAREELLRGLPMIKQIDQLCDASLAGKQRRNVFLTEEQYWAGRTMVTCVDPSRRRHTPSGGKYFLLLVDDQSLYMWLTLLARKDQAVAAIKTFKARAEAESGLKLGVLQTDRGGEFTSVEFAEYCAGEEVWWHLTASYNPQQNGVVERRKVTVVVPARSMLKTKGLPG
jgi:hypothetical protein